MKLGHGGQEGKRDRVGRKHDRIGRKQDRIGEKQDPIWQKQDRTENKRDRTGWEQDRSGREDKRDRIGRLQEDKRDRIGRLQEDLRRMRSMFVARDNLVGTRQDPQVNLCSPVLESHLEEEKRSAACEQRIKYGNFFLLLHLLDPWVKADDATQEFKDFYVYAGFDCTNKWANFLGDVPRRQAMAMPLQEALGVKEEEIFLSRQSQFERMESGRRGEGT